MNENKQSEDRKRNRNSTDSESSYNSSPSHKQVSKKTKDSLTVNSDQTNMADIVSALKLALSDPDVIKLITNATVSKLQTELSLLKTELKKKDEKIKQLDDRVEQLEMYGRRNGIRVHGIPELANENTDNLILKLAGKIGAEIPAFGLGRSHRVGKPRQNGHRPIIVKFISHNLKVNMLKMKKNLEDLADDDICEGSQEIFMNEDLTALRANWAKRARDLRKKEKIKHTWTRDGIIFIKATDESLPIRISTDEELVEAELEFNPGATVE